MTYEQYLNNRHQYQEIGRDLFLEKKHACLFYEPGKGKTYPAIEAMLEVNKQKAGKAKVLIISSADAIKKMWKPEIEPQNILPDETYLVTSMTAIQDDMMKELLSITWDIILVDECHILKSHNAKICKLVHRISMKTEYAWGLTGTPRGNRDLDIWNQFHQLNINGQGKLSFHAFTRMACTFETIYGAYGRIQSPIGFTSKFQPIWDEMLREYAMFVDYDEDDEMPEFIKEVIEIEYEHTDDYKRALKGIIEVGDFATTTNKLIAIRKAQQACNGYLYLPDKDTFRLHDNGKIAWVQQNLIHNTEKCVLIYWYQEDFKELSRLLGDRATYDVNVFKRGNHQFLLLQESCGRSFNLQDHCSKIVFYTYAYSFIDYKQVIHRCWRKGQKETCRVQVLQLKNTIEKHIWDTVLNKQSAHDMYMSIRKAI